MTDILIKIFWVLIICCLASMLWFIFDKEKSRATTIVTDNTATLSEYETKIGNKALLFINRGCEVTWKQYDDGIVINIKFNEKIH
jgi:hypothetical protein